MTSIGMAYRNDWIDNAKGIGIVLVVYGHVVRGLVKAGLVVNSSTTTLVDSVIYSFHMPLFFFLAGLLFVDTLARRGRVGLVFSKVDTIVYPYIVWSLIQGLCEVLLSKYTNGNVTVSEVFALAWQPRAQFWFLYALFVVFTVCALLYVRLEKRLYVALLLLFALLYVFKSYLWLNLLNNFFYSYAVFFALGICFNEIRTRFEKRIALATAIFGVLFLLGQYLFHISYGLGYEHGGWQTLALATVSVFFVVSVSIWLRHFRSRWLQILGGASMSIYLMHILAGSGARVVLKNYLHVYDAYTHVVVGLSVGLFVPLLAHLLIKRYGLDFLLSCPQRISLGKLRYSR